MSVLDSLKRNINLTQEERLVKEVRKFLDDNKIHCPETIYQTDHVIQNAYEFIEILANIVGYVDLDDS